MWRCIPVILFLLFVTPSLAQAQIFPGGPDQIVPVECRDPDQCGTCEFVQLTNNVIDFIIFFASVAAVLLFIYAGFRLVTSGGSEGALTNAKSMFVNVLIGYVILLAAFLIIDTLLRGLLPDSAEGTSQILNWRDIECIYPTAVRDELIEVAGLADPDPVNLWTDADGRPVGVTTGSLSLGNGGSGSGGSCNVAQSGYCAVNNLTCFGGRASDASQVCNIESGGNPQATSGTDLCKDRRSFSGGLFQINILANNRFYNNCSPDFFTKVGSGAQGECLDWVENSEGVRYCQIRNCWIDNIPKYEACMLQTYTPSTNISIACELFKESGNDFDPWITSAQRCNVQ